MISADSILEQLLEWASRHPGLRCHLLADPAMRDAREEWQSLATDIGERRTPIAVHESLFPADQRPCFHALDFTREADLAILESSIGMLLEDWQPESAFLGQGHRVCGCLWVADGFPRNDLARHLALQAVQYNLSRSGRILLRYFDPRVLDLLWQGLTDSQHAALLGPIQAWHFIDRTGAFRTLNAARESTIACSERVTLNERQWAMLHRVGLVNQTLTLVQAASGLPPHSGAALEADVALSRAQLYGLTDEPDLIEFARLALTRHARFDQHRLIHPILQSVRDGGEFSAGVQSITADQWQQISADLQMR